MSINEVLKILGLNNNYTEEELKKAYLKELKSELEYINSIDSRDKVFEIFRENFRNITTNFYFDILKYPDSMSLQYNYDWYRKEYFELLCYYTYENWNISKVIEFVNGSLKIDNTTILKSVRTNMTIVINKILNKELKKFKTMENYNNIESVLLGIRDGYTTLCL